MKATAKKQRIKWYMALMYSMLTAIASIIWVILFQIIFSILGIYIFNNTSVLLFLFYFLFTATGCYLICRYYPRAWWFTPVISNLLSIEWILEQPTLLWLYLLLGGGWLFTFAVSWYGGLKGRKFIALKQVALKLLMITGIFLSFSHCNHENNSTRPGELGTLIDSRDSRTYQTIKIGEQWIMAENFAYKPENGNYWLCESNTNNNASLGYLYDWRTARQIAPEGWHLPSLNEWRTLIRTLKSDSLSIFDQFIDIRAYGMQTRAAGLFSYADQEFEGLNKITAFWCSTTSMDGPYMIVVDFDHRNVYHRSYINPDDGKSVRYFKNR